MIARRELLVGAASALAVSGASLPARADDAKTIDAKARMALDRLYDLEPSARKLGETAVGILVFPTILKAGFIFGGQIGDGILLKGGKTDGFYRSVSASVGLQLGAQIYGYAMFFSTPRALDYLDNSDGWEIGVGPSIVLMEAGAAQTYTTSTSKIDIRAYIFDQKGVMAAANLEGTKITRIAPPK